MEFVLDTNLASFILDRELWARKPASLMRARQEITAYHLASSNLEMVPSHYEPLKRSIVAFQWFKESKPKTILPMTVQTELSLSNQVSP